MSPLRVLLVNDMPADPPFGGAEVYLGRVAAALEANGDIVELHTRTRLRNVLSMPLTFWDPIERRSLRRHIHAFKPDVIHYNNVFRELSGAVLGAVPEIPTVMTVHDQRVIGVTMGQGSRARNAVDRRVKQPIDRRVARRHIDVMLPVSGAIEQGLRSFHFPDVELVPVPAPSPSHALTAPSESCNVAFVGRLARDKGIDVLLDAWPAIRAGVHDATLVIAGDGPLRKQVDEVAARLQGVTVLGKVKTDEVSALLAECAFLVVPSLPDIRPEGSPLVAVEAAMHGRPLLVSDDPGLVELANRFGNGVIVPAGDSDRLAAAIIALLADPAERDRLGDAGRTAAESLHHIDPVINRTRAAYKRAISKSGDVSDATRRGGDS